VLDELEAAGLIVLTGTAKTVDELLAEARAMLPHLRVPLRLRRG
jgi:hypothetical protein